MNNKGRIPKGLALKKLEVSQEQDRSSFLRERPFKFAVSGQLYFLRDIRHSLVEEQVRQTRQLPDQYLQKQV